MKISKQQLELFESKLAEIRENLESLNLAPSERVQYMENADIIGTARGLIGFLQIQIEVIETINNLKQ